MNTYTRKPGLNARGKVAMVEIAATDRTTLLIEVSLDGQTLTITDETDAYPINDQVRALAAQLIAAVKEQVNHG